jgi:hypothetical protein
MAMEIVIWWLLLKLVSKFPETNFREEKNSVQNLEKFVNKFNNFKKLYIFIFVKKLDIFYLQKLNLKLISFILDCIYIP